jgi:hypothetical protein
LGAGTAKMARNLAFLVSLVAALLGGAISAGVANASTIDIYTLSLTPYVGFPAHLAKSPNGSGTLTIDGTDADLTIVLNSVGSSHPFEFSSTDFSNTCSIFSNGCLSAAFSPTLTSLKGVDNNGHGVLDLFGKDLLADFDLVFLESIQVTGFSVINEANATPLPAAWTMMLIGLVGLGFVAYRSNNKSSLAISAV